MAEPPLGPDVDKEVLDDSQGSIIMGLISQLRKGSDLHRVTLPTFVLEPRSMTERITDFMSHPDLLLGTPKKEDPVARFIEVVKYFLSGWHIRPKGVKKPYNPVLGEHFKCRWEHEDGTESVYVCEQVSHHPPISAYMYASPENNVVITGDLRPSSKFLGNSAATIMGGGSKIIFLNHPGEEYLITLPNIYARGILFGTMFMELGDSTTLRCPKNDLICEIEFKVKGFFTGTYNGLAAKIKVESTGEVLYNITGKWSEVLYIQKPSWPNKDVLFDVSKSSVHSKIVVPESEQNEFESRRLWSKVTSAISSRNMDLATTEKASIEDNQRHIVKKRAAEGVEWQSQFFRLEGNEWKFKYPIPEGDPVAVRNELKQQIFAPPSQEIHQKFWLATKS